MSTRYASFLQHHGVKGMKWGVRRYRNEDGTLTEEGKKRYQSDVSNAKTKKQEHMRLASEALKSKNYAKAKEHAASAKYYDREISNFKARYKAEKLKGKTKRQLELEEKYQKENKLTKEEAELAAARKIQTERLIKTAAGIGVAAAAGYVAYRYWDNNVDRVVKGPLQNLTTQDLDMDRPFYVSHNIFDNFKYQGFYGKQLADTHGSDSVIKNVISTKGEGLKVASRKTATKYMNGLLDSDSNFKAQVKSTLETGELIDPFTAKKALAELDSGKLGPKSYDLLNRLFTQGAAEINPNAGEVRDKLFDNLKKSGYSAVKDMNDARYSGYGSKDPLIVFGGAAKSVLEKPVSEVLSSDTIQKKYVPSAVSIYAKQLVPSGVAVAGVVAGPKLAVKQAQKSARKKQDIQYVREYRKEHPNSTLSVNEILRMRDRRPS